MKLYARGTRNGGTFYATYEGMDEDTVRGLLTDLGATDVTFLTEEEYMTATAKETP